MPNCGMVIDAVPYFSELKDSKEVLAITSMKFQLITLVHRAASPQEAANQLKDVQKYIQELLTDLERSKQ